MKNKVKYVWTNPYSDKQFCLDEIKRVEKGIIVIKIFTVLGVVTILVMIAAILKG